MKKSIFIGIIMSVLMFNIVFASETLIKLSGSEILVNNEFITENLVEDIFLQKIIENHPDVAEENKNLENKVVTITKAGTYKITGTGENVQIRVDTADEADVILILDNLSLTCKTAPAILIKNAYDTKTEGTANVKIILENQNVITGSHVAEYYDDEDKKVKHDAAISSIPSLIIDGEGSLRVNADNEGIESKMHLTINNGIIEIFSEDDALNASEDGISNLTINDGYIYAIVGGDGGEGDGMDSNGYITINGGVVTAQAHPGSQDSGLDADLGIKINGGTIIATGNMYEGIDENSEQQFMQMYFSEKQNDLIVITKEDLIPVIAFKPINSFSILECSSKEFENGKYFAFVGGEIEGEERDGVYTNIKSYKEGEKLSHTGTMVNNRRPIGNNSNMNNGDFRPNGEMQRPFAFALDDLDYTGIELPEGVTEEEITEILKQVIEKNFNVKDFGNFKNDDGRENNFQRPQANEFGKLDDSEENRSYEFVLSETEHVYRDVAAIDVSKIINEDTSNSVTGIINSGNNISILIICTIVIVACTIIIVLRKKK